MESFILFSQLAHRTPNFLDYATLLFEQILCRQDLPNFFRFVTNFYRLATLYLDNFKL